MLNRISILNVLFTIACQLMAPVEIFAMSCDDIIAQNYSANKGTINSTDIIEIIGSYDTGFAGIKKISNEDASLIIESANRLGIDPLIYAEAFKKVFLKHGGYSTLFEEGSFTATIVKIETDFYASRGQSRTIPIEETIVETIGAHESGRTGVRKLSPFEVRLIIESAKRLGVDQLVYIETFKKEFLKNGRRTPSLPGNSVEDVLRRLENGPN